MKLGKLYVSLLFLVTVVLASCEKYLDKKSNSGLDVPNQISDLQALLDDALIMNQGATPSMGEASADDYFTIEPVLNSMPTNDQELYRFIPFEYVWDNDWARSYTPVYNSNYCLEMLKEIEITASNKLAYENVKGSALFFRSYYFLQLAWCFAKTYDESTASSDLGIVLRLGSDFNVPSARATVKETYERIIQDAKEAVDYLPDFPKHVYRPSKAAAYGLLARTYLSMRQYDSAFKYANLCLGLKYELLDYSADIDLTASFPFTAFNKETIFHTEMYKPGGLVSIFRSVVDTALYASYADNDLRKQAYWAPSMGFYRFKGSYTKNPIMFSGIATDEIYFIRAEAYARDGNKDAALNDLNKVLATRYDPTFVPVTATDADDALQIILTERRKELFWRGLRFPDIKRLNKEGHNIIPTRVVSGQTYTLPPNDNRYALPLPKDVIDQSGVPQN